MSDSSASTGATSDAAFRPTVNVHIDRDRQWPTALIWGVALVAFCCVVFFYDLSGGSRPAQIDCWVGQTAREMQTRADRMAAAGNSTLPAWIVPFFSGDIRLNKFPLPYWQVMAASELLNRPIDAGLIRVFGGLHALGIVLIIFGLGYRFCGTRVAVFGGFTMAASVFLIDWSHRAASDVQVSFWCLASLACILMAFGPPRPGESPPDVDEPDASDADVRVSWSSIGWMFFAYVTAGIAMLSKGPIPLFCIGGPAIAYVAALWLLPGWLGRGDLPKAAGARLWHLVKRSQIWWGLPLFVVVWGWWVAMLIPGVAYLEHGLATREPAVGWFAQTLGLSRGWELAAMDVWVRWRTEFVDRGQGDLVNLLAETQFSPVWFYLFYLPIVLFYMLPWALSVPVALVWAVAQKVDRRHREPLLWALIYFGVVLLFFSLLSGKENRYSVMMLPPLGLLLGHHLAWAFSARPAGDEKPRWPTVLACGAAMIVVPVGFFGAWLWIGGIVPADWLASMGIKHTATSLFGEETLPLLRWSFGALVVIFTVGTVGSTMLFLRNRRGASFGVIVAMVAAAFLVYRPTLDEEFLLRDSRGVYAFAEQLKATLDHPPAGLGRGNIFTLKIPTESVPTDRIRMFASDNRDARLVWATNWPLERVIDQLERDRQLRQEDVPLADRVPLAKQAFVDATFDRLSEPVPTLVMTELRPFRKGDNIITAYTLGLVADRLEAMPTAPYVWIREEWGRDGSDYSVTLLGNVPPPPELANRLPPDERRITPASLNLEAFEGDHSLEALKKKLEDMTQ